MKVLQDYPLSEFLWYKIGGRTKFFVEISSQEDIPLLIDFLKEKQPKHLFICGLGSNLVFTDEYYDGAVIAVAASQERKPIMVSDEGLLHVFAGDTIDTVIQFAFEHSLTGLEWAGGLPGTVGAGVRGNVGAFGGEIKDVIDRVEVISLDNPERGVYTVSNDELAFSYRHSLIKEQKNLLIISAFFKLNPNSDDEMAIAQKTYEANKEYRREHHPLEFPNCGSVFKNIKSREQVDAVLSVWPEIRDQVEGKWHGKVSMGYIIRRLDLAGYAVRQAEISEKHSNFIINRGGATASDVRMIIAEVKKLCHDLFGFTPEVEVEIVT